MILPPRTGPKRYKYKNKNDRCHYYDPDRREKQARASIENMLNTIKNTSPETKLKQQKHHEAKKETEAILSKLEPKLQQQSQDLIQKMLEDVKTMPVGEVYKKYEKEITELRKNSDFVIKCDSQLKHYYENFANQLIYQFNDFAYYFPYTCITGKHEISSLFFYKENMDDKKRQMYYEKFLNEGAFNNPMFRRRYLRFFPERIFLMDDFDDLKFALSIDASKFLSLTTRQREMLFSNPLNMAKVLKSAPLVVKYFDIKTLKYAMNNAGKMVANAILADSSVLSNPYLTNELMKECKFKAAIQGHVANKQTFLKAFGDKLDNYPYIKAYLTVDVATNPMCESEL